MDAMKSFRLPAVVVGLALTLGAGCGDKGRVVNTTTDEAQQSERKHLGDEYIAQKTNVIMPWTHQLEDQLIDQIQVEADRLVVPLGTPAGDAVADFDRGDVVVSAKPDQPFLRKILKVEQADGQVIFETRNAQLTEAVYKGQLTQEPITPALDEGVRRQRLAQEADRITTNDITIGVPDSDLSGLPNVRTESGKLVLETPEGIELTAEPQIRLNASFYFDVKIEPANGMDASHTRFEGTKTCRTSDHCFPNAAAGENRGVSCQAGQCVFESTEYDGFWFFDGAGPSCNDIIAALDFAEQNASCQADFDAYYDGGMTLDQVKAGTCGDHLPPHPVQVDWAKDHCSGALKRMVFDAEGELTPSTGPITMGLSVSEEKSWTMWKTRDKRLMSRMFFIGWLPVYITANGNARLTAKIEASAELTVGVEPIEVSGLRYGDGFHYYGSSSEDDDLGVRMNDGRVEKFYDGTGWGRNPVRQPNPQWSGVTFSEQDVTTRATASASGKMQLIPRIDLLLYDAAGPYIEPFSPYVSFSADARGVFSVRDGVEGPGGCGDKPSVLCGRAGIESKVGITAANLCGNDCDWNTTVNDTCSDYCPDNNEMPLCYKKCLGDAEEPSPFTARVRWDSETVDLDLRLASPEKVDYQDDTPTPMGFTHEGDTCPPQMGTTCSSTRDNEGQYSESISLDQEAPALRSGTEIVIEVENFNSEGQDSFDLVIEEDGQVVQEWSGQPTGSKGDVSTFTYSMP